MEREELNKLLDIAISQVEWDKSMEIAAALDKAKDIISNLTPELYAKLTCALTHNIEVCENCKGCGATGAAARINLVKELSKLFMIMIEE